MNQNYTNIAQLLQTVRDALNARGSTTIRNLGRTFRLLDSYDGNKKVSRDEFYVGLHENGVKLTRGEADALLNYFDRNRDGNIDFDEFLIGIRGKMNSKRQAMTDKAFLKFDRDGNGYITVDDLRGVYNTSAHPKVQKGEMTQDQAFTEFLKNFADRNGDGKITKEEWDDYYNGVSASIDNDDHFVLLMKIAWKLEA